MNMQNNHTIISVLYDHRVQFQVTFQFGDVISTRISTHFIIGVILGGPEGAQAPSLFFIIFIAL